MTPTTDDVLFDRRGGLGIVTLNRPGALNALTLAMVDALHPQLDEWANDERIVAVLIRGAGEKAFCAGGDVRGLWRDARDGDIGALDAFYEREYALNRAIAAYPKPYVALIDGITMGGGVGVSVHGRYRIATEATVFAMPETGIGFFPDVGGTHFLPRCPGEIGMYLGLTGARLKAADAIYAGIATHYMARAATDDLLAALADAADAHGVARILDELSGDPGSADLAGARQSIDRIYAADSLAGVIAALTADTATGETARMLSEKSPLALAVTFRQLRAGRTLDLAGAFDLERRLARRMALAGDFVEGVRALLIDKDRAPRWRHADVAAVDPAEVDALFAP